MLRELRLIDFKNFRDATLGLGPFTAIVGANATGKSNIRDAFRFLHGISRGYGLAEIIGEKWIEGGVLQWRGIRGGTREVCFRNAPSFRIEASFDVGGQAGRRRARYAIQVGFDGGTHHPVVQRESLRVGGSHVFDSHPGSGDPVTQQDRADHLVVRMHKTENQRKFGQRLDLLDFRPGLVQVAEHQKLDLRQNREDARAAVSALAAMRFLDLDPSAMRVPSIPGQTILGDRGENLSSVLQAICEDAGRKATLIEWVRELTPMDAADFEFLPDAAGRVLLSLVERSGQQISALSASDGTLRFLAMIAALLGPQAASFYFFEEIDNGIHPARLHLLLQLIESRAATGAVQVVATTHSPDLMALLNAESLEDAALVSRAEGEQDARIRRIVEIPGAREVLRTQSLGRLHAAGWLEDAVSFTPSEAA